MANGKKKLIVLGGPTASGKTSLSIALAKAFSLEIISADSMQIYRTLDIATAKPTVEEREGVPHHLFDVADPGENFSVSDYVRLASEAIEDISSRGRVPMVVGGTGFYIKALTEGADLAPVTGDPAYRAEMEAFAEKNGDDALWKTLDSLDPVRASEIHPHNRKRVIRALELIRATGKKASELSFYAPEPKYDLLTLTLDFSDRALLASRIDRRVDLMMKAGLPEEARRVLAMHLPPSSTAMQAIGYKEFIGASSPEEAAALIKLRSRQYAKRQQTWFRGVKDAYPLPGELPFEELLRKASERVSSFLAENDAER